MTKFAKYLLYAGMGLAALVVFALSGQIGKFVGRTVGETTVENYQEGKQEAFLEKGQAMAAEEIRKQLPMRIDEITTLQSVLSAGKALIYNYRMSLKKSDLDTNEFIAKMTENLAHNVCQQKQMRNILNLGGNYKYVYMGADGLLIGDITITLADCSS